MKKWFTRLGLVILILVGGLLLMAAWSDSDTTMRSGHKQNDKLPTIKSGWLGTPVDQKDRFINDEFPFLPKTFELLKWQVSGNEFKQAKENDTARLEVKDPREFLASDRDGILWLGHASFYIRLGGIGILTDPIFGEPPFVTRFVKVPSPLENMRQVDYVLLSHDHRDHMDESTLRAIATKFPKAVFLAGLRSEDVLGEWTTPGNSVHTAGWFQEFDLQAGGHTESKSVAGLNIFFLPVRHWSRRGLLDTNWRLWGGYILKTDKASIYFGGDSGYGRHYREAAELFPTIDYFLIGIGAYEPRWFMEANHNNPSDAVKAFVDSGARFLVPMHYGTFDLSDEPPSAPFRSLLEEAEKAGVKDRVRQLAINESLEF